MGSNPTPGMCVSFKQTQQGSEASTLVFGVVKQITPLPPRDGCSMWEDWDLGDYAMLQSLGKTPNPTLAYLLYEGSIFDQWPPALPWKI